MGDYNTLLDLIGPGVRIRARGSEGTVRYVGETEFAPGIWVGLDLDEASGKNDGSVQGFRYFDARPSHGLFIRLNTIQKIISFPEDLRVDPQLVHAFNEEQQRIERRSSNISNAERPPSYLQRATSGIVASPGNTIFPARPTSAASSRSSTYGTARPNLARTSPTSRILSARSVRPRKPDYSPPATSVISSRPSSPTASRSELIHSKQNPDRPLSETSSTRRQSLIHSSATSGLNARVLEPTMSLSRKKGDEVLAVHGAHPPAFRSKTDPNQITVAADASSIVVDQLSIKTSAALPLEHSEQVSSGNTEASARDDVKTTYEAQIVSLQQQISNYQLAHDTLDQKLKAALGAAANAEAVVLSLGEVIRASNLGDFSEPMAERDIRNLDLNENPSEKLSTSEFQPSDLSQTKIESASLRKTHVLLHTCAENLQMQCGRQLSALQILRKDVHQLIRALHERGDRPGQRNDSSEISESLEFERLQHANADLQQNFDKTLCSTADLQRNCDTARNTLSEIQASHALQEAEAVATIRRLENDIADYQSRIAGLEHQLSHAGSNDRLQQAMDALEMVTLDKEVAEERALTYREELIEVRDKLADITLQRDIMQKNQQLYFESSDNDFSNDLKPSTMLRRMHDLEQQNTQLRVALLRLRNFSMAASITSQSSQLSNAVQENEKLRTQVAELMQNVDAARSSDSIITNLTDKQMQLGERIDYLMQERQSLLTTCSLSEQLIQCHALVEKELHHELAHRDYLLKMVLRRYKELQECNRVLKRTLLEYREQAQLHQRHHAKDHHSSSREAGETVQQLIAMQRKNDLLRHEVAKSGLEVESMAKASRNSLLDASLSSSHCRSLELHNQLMIRLIPAAAHQETAQNLSNLIDCELARLQCGDLIRFTTQSLACTPFSSHLDDSSLLTNTGVCITSAHARYCLYALGRYLTCILSGMTLCDDKGLTQMMKRMSFSQHCLCKLGHLAHALKSESYATVVSMTTEIESLVTQLSRFWQESFLDLCHEGDGHPEFRASITQLNVRMLWQHLTESARYISTTGKYLHDLMGSLNMVADSRREHQRWYNLANEIHRAAQRLSHHFAICPDEDGTLNTLLPNTLEATSVPDRHVTSLKDMVVNMVRECKEMRHFVAGTLRLVHVIVYSSLPQTSEDPDKTESKVPENSDLEVGALFSMGMRIVETLSQMNGTVPAWRPDADASPVERPPGATDCIAAKLTDDKSAWSTVAKHWQQTFSTNLDLNQRVKGQEAHIVKLLTQMRNQTDEVQREQLKNSMLAAKLDAYQKDALLNATLKEELERTKKEEAVFRNALASLYTDLQQLEAENDELKSQVLRLDAAHGHERAALCITSTVTGHQTLTPQNRTMMASMTAAGHQNFSAVLQEDKFIQEAVDAGFTSSPSSQIVAKADADHVLQGDRIASLLHAINFLRVENARLKSLRLSHFGRSLAVPSSLKLSAQHSAQKTLVKDEPTDLKRDIQSTLAASQVVSLAAMSAKSNSSESRGLHAAGHVPILPTSRQRIKFQIQSEIRKVDQIVALAPTRCRKLQPYHTPSITTGSTKSFANPVVLGLIRFPGASFAAGEETRRQVVLNNIRDLESFIPFAPSLQAH